MGNVQRQLSLARPRHRHDHGAIRTHALRQVCNTPARLVRDSSVLHISLTYLRIHSRMSELLGDQLLVFLMNAGCWYISVVVVLGVETAGDAVACCCCVATE